MSFDASEMMSLFKALTEAQQTAYMEASEKEWQECMAAGMDTDQACDWAFDAGMAAATREEINPLVRERWYKE